MSYGRDPSSTERRQINKVLYRDALDDGCIALILAILAAMFYLILPCVPIALLVVIFLAVSLRSYINVLKGRKRRYKIIGCQLADMWVSEVDDELYVGRIRLENGIIRDDPVDIPDELSCIVPGVYSPKLLFIEFEDGKTTLLKDEFGIYK